MVGSDWPVCTLAGDYARVMSVFTEFTSALSSDDRDALLGGTAADFWRLDLVRRSGAMEENGR